MEKLTPPQLVLLNILIVFVTSIATTIIAIALLADTPLSVTQVINNVTEREKVAVLQIEELKQDIISEIEEFKPIVAGASVANSFDLRDIEDQHVFWNEGRLVLGVDGVLSIEEEIESDLFGPEGLYEVPVEGLVFFHSKDFIVTTVNSFWLDLGDDLYLYNKSEERLLKSYVSTMVERTKEQGSGYQISTFEVPDCQVGFVVFDQAGDLAGVCVSEGKAITEIKRTFEASNEKETTQEEA